MPISKLGQRRQVVIPKAICDALGLKIGDFVEMQATRGRVVIKPKKLVDADDVLTPEEEKIARGGRGGSTAETGSVEAVATNKT